MSKFGTGTAFARLLPLQARVVLGVVALAAVFFVAVTLSPLKSGFADAPSRGPGDVALYRAEVDRIQHGENYYSAAAEELRARGYPTQSLFNWRTPLPVWLIGSLPDPILGKALLGFLALATACMAFAWMEREGRLASALLGFAALSGALLPCVLGDLYVMPVLWSGVCIALSLAAFGTNRGGVGVAAGLAALFLRELAAPYCLVCLGLAVYQRRRGEVAAWLVGLTAYGVYFAVHALQVLPLIGAHDVAHSQGWLRFGGVAFVISTVQMNAYLMLLPQWVTALYLPIAMLGFAGWNSGPGQRAALTAAAYTIAFGIAGHDFNQYWGSMTAPLLALGAARFPAAMRDLVSTCHGQPVAQAEVSAGICG